MRREVPTIRPVVPKRRGDAEWFAQSVEYYADNDAAQSGTIGSGQETWMQTTVVGPGNVSFRYMMSSVSGDALAFYVDESFKASWSQGSSWPWTGNFAVPSGTHTLKWKYYKYSGSTEGSCWIDAIQWSGGVPGSGGGADWEQITYTYDPSGRRIAKDVDGVVTKYVYDGDQCIAEYNANDVVLRKYVYGPGIDQPICMIEAAGSYAGTYYYHFDALGSVVALSDAAGDTVQVYEYDVYGQVAASDPNHPNRFLFTGREFDSETGLYYYRARYYNPTIGRFLQTDPIGYGGGVNLYAYCGNNALRWVDPSGADPCDEGDDWTPYYQQDLGTSCVAAAVQNLLYELMLQLGENWRIPPEWVIRRAIEMIASDEGKEVDWSKGANIAYALPVINEFLQGVAPDKSYSAITPILVESEDGGILYEPTWDMTAIVEAAQCGPVLFVVLNHAVVYAETVVTESSSEDLPPGFNLVATQVTQHRVIDSSSGTDALYYTCTIARWLNLYNPILVPNW